MLTDSAEATAAEDIVMAVQDGLERTTPLALSHRIRPTGEAVVELTGDLDIATAELAVSYVTDVIKRHHGPLTIDLSALDFCDARGLAALVRMAGDAEQKDRPFRLASPARHSSRSCGSPAWTADSPPPRSAHCARCHHAEPIHVHCGTAAALPRSLHDCDGLVRRRQPVRGVPEHSGEVRRDGRTAHTGRSPGDQLA